MANLYLCDLDLNNNALTNAVIHPLSTAPPSPTEGQIYYDNTGGDKQIYVYNGSAWVPMGGDITSITAGDGMTGSGTSGAITLNVGGGAGITADADGISIDSTVTTLTGSQTLTNKTLTAPTFTTPALGTPASGVMTNATGTASGLTAGLVSSIGNLTGEVTSSNRATVIAGNVVDEANLKVSNAPTNGYFLSAQSGNQGGLTWAAISTLNQDTTGNAATATALETGRTIAMTGDVAWTSDSFNGTSDVTGTSAIQAAAVRHAMLNDDIISGQTAVTALAQGDFLVVHDTSAGTVNKITYSNFEDDIFGNVSGDGTIAAGGALTVTGTDGNFTVGGNLIVSGDTTTVNTSTLSVEDPLIKLASGNNGSDVVDIGFYGLYDHTGSQDVYTGLTRDASDDKWHLWKLNQAEPTTVVNHSGTGFAVDTLVANLEGDVTGDITGDVTGNADTVTTNANLTGHITSTGNAAILGSFTSAQLNTAISNATLSGNNTGDQTNISGNAATVTTNANLTGHITSSGNAAVLGAFTVAQLSSALSDASISGNNTGDETQSSINDLAITTVGTLDTGNATAIVSAASTSAAGKVELATTAEVLTGTDTSRAVTAAGLAARTGSWNLIVAAGSAVSGSVASNDDKTWTITHLMGSSLLYMVQVIRTANGSGETVFPCVTRSTTTTVINFNVAPTSGDYTVVIVKI